MSPARTFTMRLQPLGGGTAVVLSGPPMSGKTTLLKALSERLPVLEVERVERFSRQLEEPTEARGFAASTHRIKHEIATLGYSAKAVLGGIRISMPEITR